MEPRIASVPGLSNSEAAQGGNQSAAALSIHVDDDAAPGGDGTGKSPFNDLQSAVAAARTIAGPVVIKIAPGDYPLAQSLVIDRGALELRGSSEQVAGVDAWPSGIVDPATVTRVFATNASMPQLILVSAGDGVVLRDVTIRGLVLESTTTGRTIFLQRTQNFLVADNVFRAPGSFGIQSGASSGTVTGNHFSGVSTGAILTGGYPESPSDVVFRGNRAVRNLLGGVLLNGTPTDLPEPGDRITAVIQDNDLSENSVGNQGFGMRVFIIRRDPGLPGDQQFSASISAEIRDNRFAGNRVGVIVDAGFPYRVFNGQCDNRTYTGTIDLEFYSNTVSGSLLTPSLVTFTRGQVSLGVNPQSQYQWLHNASFTITDPHGALAGGWIHHLEHDPILSSCPNDQTNEVLGNVLTYNGQPVLYQKNF